MSERLARPQQLLEGGGGGAAVAAALPPTALLIAAHSFCHWQVSHRITMQPLSPLPKCEIGEPMVELRNVTKHYPIVGRSDAVQALKGICIGEGYPVGPIRKGEFIILRGPSGGGKTTLLNIIGCIDTVTSGSIGMLGHEITASASDAFLADLRLRSIGFVFQTFNLLGAFSAYATHPAELNSVLHRARLVDSNCVIPP